MEIVEVRLPVFLPGSNRDWREIEGIATISEDGTITVKLDKPEDASYMVELAKDGVLMQMAFDYRMAEDTIRKLNEKYYLKPKE